MLFWLERQVLSFTASLVCCGSLILFGCNSWPKNGTKLDYQTVIESPLRDAITAEAKHNSALEAIDESQYQAAEQLVQQALMADVTYGPAHNTLGKIYFDQKKYYLAAWEFEYAADAMPDRAEPRNNLGLVFEAVNRLDEAIAEYQLAHDLVPESSEYLGNLLRARVRNGEDLKEMNSEFKQLLSIETRPAWQNWCRKTLAFSQEEKDTQRSIEAQRSIEDLPPMNLRSNLQNSSGDYLPGPD